MKKLLLCSIVVLVLTACQSVDPYTGESKINNKTKYGTGGAAVGAVAGQVIGKDTKGTVIGAAVGTAIGMGYGHYRDKQELELRNSLANTGVSIKKQGDELILIMPGNITFDTNSHAIKGDFYEVLNSIGIVLKKYDKTKIIISGHTDSTGKYDYNKKLSLKRAESVSRYLGSHGINYARMQIFGHGPDVPVASNNTTDGKAKNRRVEIKIAKMDNVNY